ncbi:hypothetical protein ESCO_004128 [Escovopsis weberi]|uniref:Nucleoporin NUP53 n=1 Tax=Escovopsis weberi TaxID=150374 RepID=A0A0M8MXK5_ESCWE|nr:hypothetical protein ESCO_004128 [Escovopsis weberi]
MAPLILHNVPDDECYVGDDGIRRPYAMIFNAHEGPAGNARTRRAVAETGSFGKSTRRSRSKTGTPARGRENPTLAAADKLFGDWVSSQANIGNSNSNAILNSSSSNNNNNTGTGGGSGGNLSSTGSNANLSNPSNPSGASARKLNPNASMTSNQDDAMPQRASSQRTPVELILRGYRSSAQQYAAIAHYEALAGRVLEDYPREPPSSQRRYKSELRDPAFTRRRTLTAEERVLVNRADGGEHWVKVTFESAEAGHAAVFASPQRILGHLVHAEHYRGLAPKDEACIDAEPMDVEMEDQLRPRSTPADARRRPGHAAAVAISGLPTSFSSRLLELSPGGDSRATSQTLDTSTLSGRSSDTMMLDTTPLAAPAFPLRKLPPARELQLQPASADVIDPADSLFCRRIPTARKARLLPAEQALLPQQSVVQRVFNAVPIVKWFSGSMIGNEVPRTETGDFDWGRASLYWKIIWWFDATFGLFRGDVYSADKDD